MNKLCLLKEKSNYKYRNKIKRGRGGGFGSV